MELNRCSRCGAFYVTSNDVCPKCEPKDACEQLKLKNFLAENDAPASLEILSANTGISTKNLNRYLTNNNFKISL